MASRELIATLRERCPSAARFDRFDARSQSLSANRVL